MKTTEAELQQLRIAVATAEGWKLELGPSHPPALLVITPANVVMERNPLNGRTVEQTIKDSLYNLPLYEVSRNAIIGAIVRRFQTWEDKSKFVIALEELVGGRVTPAFALATATAEQLCRAYLAGAGIPASEGGL